MELSDIEFKKTLISCGIPRGYTDPSVGLSNIGKEGAQMLEWLQDGDGYSHLRRGSATVEIISEKPEATDAFYLTARACIRSAIPVQVMHAREMLDGNALSEGTADFMAGERCLFVDGLVTSRDDDYNNPQKAVLEWFLAKLMMDGVSLVFLHERAIQSTDFSSRFRNRITRHNKLLLTF